MMDEQKEEGKKEEEKKEVKEQEKERENKERKFDGKKERDENKEKYENKEKGESKQESKQIEEESAQELTRETIIEHLEELRHRLIYPIVTFILVFIISMPFSKLLLHVFLSPFEGVVSRFIFTKPFESFWVHIKICAYFAFFVAVPFLLWQMWLFVSPALYPNERKLAKAVILSIITLFIIGTSFGYFIILPHALSFLINSFSYDNIQPFISISDFLSFALKFSLAFGFSFQTPVVVVMLTKMGLVEIGILKKFRPYAIVSAFVIAAIITPTPDALTQTALAIPLIILWELGIFASKIINKLR